jgi:hypothetical protein
VVVAPARLSGRDLDIMSPRPEFGESFMPAAVFGRVKTLFAPAVLDGGGVLGGAELGLLVDGVGVDGPAVCLESDELVATTATIAPPITRTAANTISTILVVERLPLVGCSYEYGAVP